MVIRHDYDEVIAETPIWLGAKKTVPKIFLYDNRILICKLMLVHENETVYNLGQNFVFNRKYKTNYNYLCKLVLIL
jgi:hypothetical protein